MKLRSRPLWAAGALVLLLAVVAALHIGLVARVVRGDGALEHDEVISHLVATGHLDDWQRVIEGGPPTGRWATGAQLRSFLEIDGHTSASEIDENLAKLDIHPPLYFWLLSVARWAGISIMWSGPFVNIAAMLAAGALLFSLSLRLVHDRLLAGLTVAVFAFTPAVIRSDSYARQYPLALLATVGLIWVTATLLDKPRSPWLMLGLMGVGTAGLLTMTEFGFALAGAMLTLTFHWWRNNRRALIIAFVATAGAAAAAFLIHPSYFSQLATVRKLGSSNTVRGRIHLWAEGFFDFVTLEASAVRTLDVIALVGGVTVAVTVRWWYRRVAAVIRTEPVASAAFGIGATALAGATIAYISGRTPIHATGWPYIIWFWPSLVLFGTALLRTKKRATVALTLLVTAALLLTFSWRWAGVDTVDHYGQRRAVAAVRRSTLVVSDCVERGSTPGAAMWVPPNAKFLQLAPGYGGIFPPPPVPSDANVARPLLLQGNVPFQGGTCLPKVASVEKKLAQLGLRRGEKIGPIGFIDVYRLEPRR